MGSRGTSRFVPMTTFAAALLALAAGFTSSAGAQAMREVTYIVVNNLFSTPAYVAVENGYWAKQGLNVNIKLTSSGRAVVQALQAGDAQFGHAALGTTTASARASGNMVKGVIAYYNAADYLAKAGAAPTRFTFASGSRSTIWILRNRSS